MVIAARSLTVPRAVRGSSLLLGVTAGLAVVMTVLTVVAWWHLGSAGEAYSRASLEAGYDDGDGWPRAVLSSLVYNTVTTGATALVTGLLAVMIRQPLRWVQVTTWCVVAAVCAALGCGLNAGPDPAGSTASSDSSPFQRLGYDLVPQWYPSVNAVLGLALLAAAIGAAVMLLRSSVQDFYRPASSREDPRWSSFVKSQSSGVERQPGEANKTRSDGVEPEPGEVNESRSSGVGRQPESE